MSAKCMCGLDEAGQHRAAVEVDLTRSPPGRASHRIDVSDGEDAVPLHRHRGVLREAPVDREHDPVVEDDDVARARLVAGSAPRQGEGDEGAGGTCVRTSVW